jgi:signal transduction histidine kinase
MSHELRTPLNSVIGFSRLMADSKNMLPEEKRNLAIIHRSGQHLLTLINDILELSKIEAGRAVLQTEVVNLNDMLQEVMDMVSMRAGQTGVELVLDSVGLPASARVDGTKLRQVLLNLMSNAVKFTAQGKVTLRVRCSARNGACELAFAVIDNGPVSRKKTRRIFEPFIQADGPGAKEGTGLGLTISREFVQLMGGTLALQSVLGEGATFSFTVAVQVRTKRRWPARKKSALWNRSSAAASWWPTTTPTAARCWKACSNRSASRWRWSATARRRWRWSMSGSRTWCSWTGACRRWMASAPRARSAPTRTARSRAS